MSLHLKQLEIERNQQVLLVVDELAFCLNVYEISHSLRHSQLHDIFLSLLQLCHLFLLYFCRFIFSRWLPKANNFFLNRATQRHQFVHSFHGEWFLVEPKARKSCENVVAKRIS